MIKVFLSYNHRDSGQAQPLVNALRAAGIEAIDTAEAAPGEALAHKFEEKLSEVNAVLVLITDHYLADPQVFTELAQAIRTEKRIIPIRLKADVDSPAILRPYQSVDLTDPGTRDQKMAKLIRFLQSATSTTGVDFAEETKRINEQIHLLELEHSSRGRDGASRRAADAGNLVIASTSAAGAGMGALVAGPLGAILGATIGALLGKSIQDEKQRSSKGPRKGTDSGRAPAERDVTDG